MNQNEIPLNRLAYCPHCESKTQLDMVFPPWAKNQDSRPQPKLSESEASFSDQYDNMTVFFIWRCRVCEKLVFSATYFPRGRAPKSLTVYPSGLGSDSQFSEVVPPDVLEDYLSAIKCFEFEEYRACAAMCRRSLQSGLLAEGAPRTTLEKQIDEMHAKDRDKFTKNITDSAHKIRIFGNWGAQPDDDGLQDVTKEEAHASLKFLSNLFNYVYKMPAEVSKSNSLIASKKQKKTP